LILRTKGRTSGQQRKAPLIFGRNGDDYLIVASKGGAPEHPGWYQNLVANPDIEIQVKGDVLPVRARTASADEKKKLWPIMTKDWPDYDKYQHSTNRDIPLVILSPR
jgi:deazaflavin-dependent oxidoreductase (nitroreductase family)